MFEVMVSGWFSASHQLRLPGGSYEPLHGHNWHVRISYAADELDQTGVLLDFVALRRRLKDLLGRLHDQHLNALPEFEHRNPTAENVAVHIAEQLRAGGPPAGPHWVEVEEEPGCCARYWPGWRLSAAGGADDPNRPR